MPRARVLIRPKEGILDPQGQAVERALPALGFQPARRTCTSGGWSSSTSRTRRQLDAMCEKLLANPLIEDYEVELLDVKFGVIRFPGSCDEVDALRACAALRRRRAALAPRPRPEGRRRGRRPRRLLLRRLPARRRDRALLAGHGARSRSSRATAARCSASATASRCCARRACCPARCCPTTSLRFLCRQVDVDVDEPRHALHARVRRAASRCRSRSSTRPAATTRPPTCSTRSRRTARSSFRYAPGQNPNGSLNDIAGVSQRGRATSSA